MENKIDRLFREKLGGMEMMPSTRGWEQISRGAVSRKSTMPWIRWAAAVFLLVMGIAYLFERGQRQAMPGVMLSEKAESASQIADSPPALAKAPEVEAPAAEVIESDKTPARKFRSHSDAVRIQAPAPTPTKALSSPEERAPQLQLAVAEPAEAGPIGEQATATGFIHENPDLRADAGEFNNAFESAEPLPIRIVYKKGRQPEPDRAGLGIMQRGMEKLTALTDDLKLSEEAREKLRNTKDDLLAFNVGRLINRKNNENNELEE
jgi:hypothetical protein